MIKQYTVNPNTEYEKFAQEIYKHQHLFEADGITTMSVKHNVILVGKSGCKHQIDVYWEYKIKGVIKKVAIECKNYNSKVSIGKVRDFYGVLSDLTDIAGIMVTKKGYQSGAKQYAACYGINLHELREPDENESDLGKFELDITTNISIRRRLFLLDEEWIKSNLSILKGYREYYKMLSPNLNFSESFHMDYYPLEIIESSEIVDKNSKTISSFNKLEKSLPSKTTDPEHIFSFNCAYVNTRNLGKVKIKEIKYSYINERQTRLFTIDAQHFVKAILKDALNGKIKVIC